MDGNIWRYSPDSDQVYRSCEMNELGSGILLSRDLPVPLLYADNIRFRSYCYENHPVYMACNFVAFPAHYLPVITKDWDPQKLNKDRLGGSFSSGIYAVLMSFSANFVITLCLTVLTFIITRDRPHVYASRSLKLGSLLASINLTIALGRLLQLLSDQHNKHGAAVSKAIIKFFSQDATFTTLDFLTTLTLQLCQVFIIMRTFERNQEKKLILFCGVFLSFATNILWVIPQYRTVAGHSITWDTLPPFIYLFRIALAASYAVLVLSYIIQKRRLWCKTLQMAFLTLLTVLAVLLLPGFFIADVANVWIAELGELFTTTCYVGSTFLVWEWLERLNAIERTVQAQSILGRPIYEDEQRDYMFAQYALKIQDAIQRDEVVSSDDDENSHPHSSSHGDIELHDMLSSTSRETRSSMDRISVNQINFNAKQSHKNIMVQKLTNAFDRFTYFTDQVVLKKLGTRSLSSNSNTEQSENKRAKMVSRRIGLDNPDKTFVYNTKDVVFASDEELPEDNEVLKEVGSQGTHRDHELEDGSDLSMV
ncbi:Rim21p KNAG_0K02340 [Huiozyma naganishii CBS 8797]|uniref:pH-response regulator protein palH/RIM21 n=1 Tax=Huiozyma naganishii (strain ATCC MYA-139 / BCRC 22969 / CBS 8797 / KCTC 17520 / NBRC 10181 / NCYC 3082 / Yp74L-3) TaxID=1071383 RepID=J7S3G1_HUIN7|nr:hypothetical protein KNAG_0K02340 [Kazachstania naganishii CBS 8797]CCK72597.1 hypothetical protein KNAG_0K02340 [Kazachstania naganishii CBS 8797]